MANLLKTAIKPTNSYKSNNSRSSSSSSLDTELPQPQNSNHISTAPFRDKVITNSSYLAAEIPLKFGHFVSNLWHNNTNRQQQQCSSETIWLLGVYYHALSEKLNSIELAILEAQRTDMFRPEYNNRSNNKEEEDEDEEHSNNLLWPHDFYEDFNSKLWMTYRHNYPPIRPSNHKTDIGWGCMLRSGQSLLANTLVMNFLSRDWRRQKKSPEIVKQYKKIIHWFLDELSPRAPFSIHRIALLGKQLGKDIGEWFGPSTLSQVIQALVSDYPPANLSVYVTTDGVIYRDDVFDIATGKKPSKNQSFFTTTPSSSRKKQNQQQEEAKTLYNANNIPLSSPSSPPPLLNNRNDIWKPLLILVPLRLGIDSLHPTYYPTLKSLFEWPWFVGIAGGKPNSSLYFIGCQGDDFIYFDPHFSRPALETKPLAYYTMHDFSTYHCTIPRKIHISHLDPSMMLGFFCRTNDEFDVLCKQLKKLSEKYTPIITIQQTAPEYNDDNDDDDDIYTDEDDDDDDSDDNEYRNNKYNNNRNRVDIKCEANDFGVIAEDEEDEIEDDDDLLFV